MFLNIKIQSRSKCKLKLILKLLISFACISTEVKHKYIKKVNKKVTVLKSPHVNKTAQEHFGFHIIICKLSFYSLQLFQILIFLKELSQKYHSNIKIFLEIVIDKTKFNTKLYNQLDPDFLRINYTNLNRYSEHKVGSPVLRYIQTFENYGCVS